MTNARAEMNRIVDMLAITSDAKAALKDMYLAIEADRELGIDPLPSIDKLSGALNFIYKAQLIDDTDYEDLCMVANQYEAAEVTSQWTT